MNLYLDWLGEILPLFLWSAIETIRLAVTGIRFVFSANARRCWLHRLLPPAMLFSGFVPLDCYWKFYEIDHRIDAFSDQASAWWVAGSNICGLAVPPVLSYLAYRRTLKNTAST